MPLHPRSMLFVSGDQTERFAKAFDAGADLVCIDLEDAVAPARKATARAQVLAWLAARPSLPCPRALRINALRTLDGLRDLVALADAGVALDALLLPKTESAEGPAIVQATLGARAGAVVALLETPQGIEAAPGIARGPVAALMLGGADLSVALGASFDARGLAYARGRLVHAAKAAGRQAWDVPEIQLDDPAALVESTRAALAQGFDCKAAIHPRQLDAIHAAFRPDPAQARWATALLAAAPASGGAADAGAFVFEGRMVDAPLMQMARRIAERAARP